jgi:spermidine synthase
VKRHRVHVRTVEAGRELIVDGTFASFYQPGSVVTGSVWDAIAAPLLGLPARRRRRVLILGLGGGSAARIVRAIAPEAEIVGVELDPAVLNAAREHLDLDELGVEVVLADALEFLRDDTRDDKGRYDAILEDVFVGEGDAVHKPGWLPEPGLVLARERLAPGGVLVTNTLDEAPVVARALCGLFRSVLAIDVEDYDNRIFAAGRDLPQAGVLRSAVRESHILAPSLSRLTMRTLKCEATRGRISRARQGTAARSG